MLTVLAVCNLSASPGDVRFRKHVDDMSSEEWKALGSAISKLHDKDTFGPQGPATPPQAEPFPQSHESYEWFVQIHGNRKEAKACKHGSEVIWPWHRAFLLHFENTLRSTNPPTSSNITLPYWDWTEKPSGQVGYPKAYEEVGSALFHPRQKYGTEIPLIIASDGIPQGLSPSDYVERILEENWVAFAGTSEGPLARPGDMELKLHNEIHGYIGLDNANTVHAVRDPIFWAHHANLDRLWNQWQKVHSGEQLCSSCETVVYDRDPAMGSLKFKDVLDNDNLPGAIKVVYLAKGTPVPQSLVAMEMQATARPQIVAPSNGVAIYSFTLSEPRGYRFELRLIDVKIPTAHSYYASIYLFPDSVVLSSTTEFEKKFKVSSLGMFAQGDTGTEHATQTLVVDLTDAFQSIREEGVGKAWKLAVRFRIADVSLNYDVLAKDISVDHIELLRRDFATTRKIPLK